MPMRAGQTHNCVTVPETGTELSRSSDEGVGAAADSITEITFAMSLEERNPGTDSRPGVRFG